MTGIVAFAVATTAAGQVQAQAGAETFTGTASVKTAGGTSATSPIKVVVNRTMTPEEAKKFTDAFQSGGAAALRKALTGAKPAGSIQLGNGKPTGAQLVLARTTDKGRLLTIVADRPIVFLGAGKPGAAPTAGHDFAVVDLELDASGSGSGTMAPAAKIRVNDGAFVVEDYGGETVQLTGVKKAK